jgi:hypothetical protein
MELWVTLQAKGLKGRLRPPLEAELKALPIRCLQSFEKKPEDHPSGSFASR